MKNMRRRARAVFSHGVALIFGGLLGFALLEGPEGEERASIAVAEREELAAKGRSQGNDSGNGDLGPSAGGPEMSVGAEAGAGGGALTEEVKAGARAEKDVARSRAASLWGRVLDEKGEGIPGIQILAQPVDESSPERRRICSSDGGGYFEFKDMSFEHWRLRPLVEGEVFEGLNMEGLWSQVFPPCSLDLKRIDARFIELDVRDQQGKAPASARVIFETVRGAKRSVSWSPQEPRILLQQDGVVLRVQAGRFGEKESEPFVVDSGKASGEAVRVELRDRAVFVLRVDSIRDESRSQELSVSLRAGYEGFERQAEIHRPAFATMDFDDSEQAWVMAGLQPGIYDLLIDDFFYQRVELAYGINELRASLLGIDNEKYIKLRAEDSDGKSLKEIRVDCYVEIEDKGDGRSMSVIPLGEDLALPVSEEFLDWVKRFPATGRWYFSIREGATEVEVPWRPGDLSPLFVKFPWRSQLKVEVLGYKGSGCEGRLSLYGNRRTKEVEPSGYVKLFDLSEGVAKVHVLFSYNSDQLPFCIHEESVVIGKGSQRLSLICPRASRLVFSGLELETDLRLSLNHICSDRYGPPSPYQISFKSSLGQDLDLGAIPQGGYTVHFRDRVGDEDRSRILRLRHNGPRIIDMRLQRFDRLVFDGDCVFVEDEVPRFRDGDQLLAIQGQGVSGSLDRMRSLIDQFKELESAVIRIERNGRVLDVLLPGEKLDNLNYNVCLLGDA